MAIGSIRVMVGIAVAAVKSARDSTSDEQLRALLVELLPTLEKHEQIARRLAKNSPAAP